MFKQGGVKGVLINVEKNCKISKEVHPLQGEGVENEAIENGGITVDF